MRRAAFVFRLTASIAVVGLSPLLLEPTHHEQQLFAWSVALGWIPVAGLLEAVRRRRPGVASDTATLILDFAFLFFAFTIFEEIVVFLLAAQVLVVGYYTYLGGTALGGVAAVTSVAVAVGAAQVADHRGDETLTVLLYPITVTGMVLLMGRLARHHRQTASVADLMHEKATAIATGVAEAVVVTSPRGRIREWNEAAEVSFDCASADAVGRDCAAVLGLRREVEELDCSVGCALLRARFDGEDDDLKVWRPDPADPDRRQSFLAHVAPVTDERGQVVEVVHSFRDVSRLVEADEAKTVFLATASHELKTPLTVITGFAELLARRSDLPEDQHAQALESIQARARELTGIVDRLLLSSRIEAGHVDLDPTPVAVPDLVADRAVEVAAAVGRRVDVTAAEDVPVAIADAGAVATVVDHLLDNAMKYSDPESPIDVDVAADDRWVTLSVRDEGIGMTRDQAEQCFDRFWQAESGDRRRYGGTGIGLYVVRSLVRAMGGDVEAASRSGEGSTFTVSLPRLDAVVAADAVVAEERPEPSIIREFMHQMGLSGGGR